MNDTILYEQIFRRQTVREFAPREVPPATLSEIRTAMSQTTALTGARTELHLYEHGEAPGYSPFAVASFTERTREGIINSGYKLAQMDLWLFSQGLGACWQGDPRGPMGPPELSYGGCICFGIPKGTVGRTSVDQFPRRDLSAITDIPDPGPVLEAARLAPSALNYQPWFFTGTNDKFYLLTKRSLIGPQLTYIDTGIILLYIRLAARHCGQRADIDLATEPAGQNHMRQACITLTREEG